MRHAMLLACVLLGCGSGETSVSLDRHESTSAKSSPNKHLLTSEDLASFSNCENCTRPCREQEIICLRSFPLKDRCTDGLECVLRAMECVKSSCGKLGDCSGGLFQCPPAGPL